MADPTLLPDCHELRTRAEAVARARHARIAAVLGVDAIVGEWNDGPMDVRGYLIDAALAELRDLSTPAGRDHACRWLWALLTGEEPEWCPSWRGSQHGYEIRCGGAHAYIAEPWWAERSCDFGTRALAGISSLSPTEALAAAITAALEWRRSQP